jgi:protein-tyrosine-phosphatase
MHQVEQPKTGPKQLLRRFIPDSLLKERETFLRLGPKAGAIYAWYRLLDSVGVRPQKREPVPPSTKSILFICFGNIMRSPMAEAIFRQCTAGTHILVSAVSAGLHAIPGGAAHPRAVAASSEIGLSLVEHRAQLLSPEMVSEADVIFVMDFQDIGRSSGALPRGPRQGCHAECVCRGRGTLPGDSRSVLRRPRGHASLLRSSANLHSQPCSRTGRA